MANILTLGLGPGPILTKPLAGESIHEIGRRHLLEIGSCVLAGDRLLTTWEFPDGRDQEVITTVRRQGESDESVRTRHLRALPWH
jgi:hypothetical protein